MPGLLSVIIPSKTPANLARCISAVHTHEAVARILVVDDGVDFNEWVCRGLVTDHLAELGVRLVDGVKPFIFARNCNLGIEAAGEDDVILLNDDALLETPGGFAALHAAVTNNLGIGLVSASTNVAGNSEQHRQGTSGLRICGKTPGNSFPTVAFVCVAIPRRTINAIGLLDERFTAYGWEDNDYCRRVHQAGLQIAVCDGCYVNHAKLQSTFRGDAYAAGDINAGRKIYLDKWGSM